MTIIEQGIIKYNEPLTITDGVLDVKQTLIDICTYCRGHGSDGELSFLRHYLEPALTQLGAAYCKDGIGNIYVDSDSKVLYAAHVDTMHSTKDERIVQPLTLEDGSLGVPKGNKSVLGADDAVGIVSILSLLSQGVDIGVILLRGEERGLVGAHFAKDNSAGWLASFDICIEVDRAGTEEVITHQMNGRCSSNEFALSLAKQLGMGHAPSPHGVYTDNSLFDMIPECVNLAAGYVNQHSEHEVCDTDYVVELCEALGKLNYSKLDVCEWVDETDDWEDYYDEDAPFPSLGQAEDYVSEELEDVALYLYMNNITPEEIKASIKFR